MIVSGYMTSLIRYSFGWLDCKTVGFFSKSVKKSVKCGVRVLRARSAQASHARRACEEREKKRLSPVSLSVFSLVPDILFDCSRELEYAKIRTVLQSICWWTSRDLAEICRVLSSCSKFFITCQQRYAFWFSRIGLNFALLYFGCCSLVSSHCWN